MPALYRVVQLLVGWNETKVHSVGEDHDFMNAYKGEVAFIWEMHGDDEDDDTLSALRARYEV